MAFLEDVVDDIAGQIVSIGLSTSSDAADEITGGGYAAIDPNYGSASSGSVALPSTLEFDGPANAGPVTHVIIRRTGGVWLTQALDSPVSFNSDGKLNVTTATISAALGS